MFIVVRRAMADMVKNTPAVMAAAVPTDGLRANC